MKNVMKKLTTYAVVFALLITLLPPMEAKAATVKLNKKTATMYVGDKVSLQLKGAKSVSWKSSNKKIATVSSKGVVKGVKAGTCKITAKNKKTAKSYTCKVTVKSLKKMAFTKGGFKLWTSGRQMSYAGKDITKDLLASKMTVDGKKIALTKENVYYWEEEGETLINFGETLEAGKHKFVFTRKGYKTVSFEQECEGAVESPDVILDAVLFNNGNGYNLCIILNPKTIGKQTTITVNGEEMVSKVLNKDECNGDGNPFFYKSVSEKIDYKVTVAAEGFDEMTVTAEYMN